MRSSTALHCSRLGPVPIIRHRRLLVAWAALWLSAGLAWAANARAEFQPLTPLMPASGIEVDLRLPLSGYFRSGCRLPMVVRIKSATDRRIRLGVVPELWQVDRQPATLGETAAPLLDFQSLAGGSWSPPTVCNAVSGAGAAGMVDALAPAMDDIRRHLVVVELTDESGRYGRIVFRADLASRLHELLPDERLVVALTPPDAGGGQPTGAVAGGELPPIPAVVRLPDGSNVTPRLAWVRPEDLPTQPASWASIDLLLATDTAFADVQLGILQLSAWHVHLQSGAQGAVTVMPGAAAVHCLPRIDPGGRQPSGSLPAPQTTSQVLQRHGLGPNAPVQFPWVEERLGWGRVAVTWMPPAGDAATASPDAGAWRVRWSALLSSQLAARDPRLQPRKRVDQDAYVAVFDPQLARLPQRLIAQVWWVWAVVVTLFAAIGGYALRRKPATIQEADSNSAAAKGSGVRRWALVAGSCLTVAGMASLYATRARISAIEWRVNLTAADGSRVAKTFTYLIAWRSAGGLQLQPARSSAGYTDGLPLVAALRDFQVESGRLPAAAVGARDAEGLPERALIEAMTLDSTRPQLMLCTDVDVAGLLTGGDRAATATVMGLPGELSSGAVWALGSKPCDWAVVLAGLPPEAPPPRLATDHAGWSLTPQAPAAAADRPSPYWQAEPLWVQGAQLNLPPELHPQEDIYRPASLRWLFGQIRQVTRGPVLITFRRRAVGDCRWTVGAGALTPVVLDDSLAVEVYGLPDAVKR